ncbi:MULTISPECIES: DNA phosphorothioation-associated putative methyltransferase [Pseudoalteromonas]|uniref:DNA phosphorothioation-associated putative methyltransferase n=1 Tax=Pseudoalteromonas TaxID=53246 RepID=UPI001581D2A7|nr:MULTISPECIES: DNA phosphorothioation-associated putative methyltransferase [Pseudoalteromonas]MDI4650512.1 DNA phosphorothioation-associated putative methyltransferase [Pseudoalteromonas shioyasakiensis]NUJ36933.1 DNA phosphorothioation-associated putative methyltransferase [Pseudoalteromonas sp. 0303]
MNAEQFKQLVKKVKTAKKLPDAIYFHKDAFTEAPVELVKFIKVVAQALKVDEADYDLIKLFKNDFRLSLLSYPSFYEDSYPALKQSVTVDLAKLSHKVTKYDNSDNPPILHRKETMVSPSSKHYQLFCDLTAEGEQAGLYENTRMIGFKGSWERLIAKKGYELVDGRLFRSPDDDKTIDRHLTAIVRHELSAPLKTLAKNGFLNGDYSIFDYGCGRGDDLRELEAHGIDALGWDLNYRPDADKVISDIVNIGFVINVIEDRDERIEALVGAWELSQKLLVVSAMLGNESLVSQFQPYKDGVITSRNTFQKYYTQAELKAFIEMSVDENAIAVAPGIYYIFKDKQLEQHFLQNRHKRTYKWQHLTAPEPVNEEQARILFTQHQQLFESFWLTCLTLGRCPANDEFAQSDKIKKVIGSNKKALQLVLKWFEEDELKTAETMRKEDLLLYFALAMFEKRKPYTQQPEDLKRDIKAFFDTYKIAQNQATELLFQIADSTLIESLCLEAEKLLPAGKVDFENGQPHALTLHKDFITLLPIVLRVYIGAALQMYGELDDIQLIKIHIHSGKVTLLGYEGFYDSPLPQLKERVKIKMAEQDVDFFDYVIEEKRPLLLNKIDYIDDTFDDYKKQKSFNLKLGMLLETKPSLCTNSLLESLLKPVYKIKGYRFYK